MTQRLTLFRAIILLPSPTVIAASDSENGADDNDAKTSGVELLVLKYIFLHHNLLVSFKFVAECNFSSTSATH